jgi:excisionase family DNA binding protein
MKRGVRKSDTYELRRYFRIPEVAKRWGVSESSIRRMIERGDLAVTRFGNSVRISLDEIRKQEATSE